MNENLKKALLIIEKQYLALEEKLLNPEVLEDHKLYTKLQKEQAKLKPTFETFKEYQEVLEFLEQAKHFLEISKETADIAFGQTEVAKNQEQLLVLEDKLKLLMLPKDEDDERDVIVEIRGAAGGEEANLFAQDLLKIYQKFISLNKWNFNVLDTHYSENGGFTQVVFSINGRGVYGTFKFEAGVHRVQRVPITESIGRVHTSTVTVVVIPELPPEEEIVINQDELRIDTYRSSGAGGQSVNTTDSAVRVTHLPSGIVVNCQKERSQIANKELAIRILKAKLIALQKEAIAQADSGFRKQGGSGARAEKIRTYNWSQDRVTDHRVALSISLRNVLEGKLQPFFEALKTQEQAKKIENSPLFNEIPS